jgi:hypothetical protein
MMCRTKTISDLVASFLVPEVDRQAVRAKLRNSEDKYLMAAHHAVHPESVGKVEACMEEAEEKGSE